MGRTRGATNKEVSIPEVFTMDAEQRLTMLTELILDLVSEELCKAD